MRRKTLFGVVVVLVGLLYLLVQMGVISAHSIWLTGAVLWPLLFVLLGLAGLAQARRKGNLWGAVFLLVYGTLLSLKGVRVFPWLNHIGGWALFFGIFIILFGFSFLFPRRFRFHPYIVIHTNGKKRSRRDRTGSEDAIVVESLAGMNDSHRWRKGDAKGSFGRLERQEWRLIGDLSVGKSPWVLRDLNLWNGMGDIRVNLATAHVEEGTYQLNVHGWIGDIRILVPEGLPVHVRAHVSVGDLSVFSEEHSGTGRFSEYQDPAFAEAARRCCIDVGLSIGDVTVVRV